MEVFFRTHSYLVEHTNTNLRRSLMDEIDWTDRLIGIKGTRGVGKTTFETCEWIGRFSQEAEKLCVVNYINRKDEKMYLCGTMNANDTSIRHALIDRFAQKDFRAGKGTRKDPDYFYGVSKDCWSSIAIATVFLDMQKEKKNETI